MPSDPSAVQAITSRKNPLIQELLELRDNRQSRVMFLEGPRLVKEALDSSSVIDVLLYSPAFEHNPLLSSMQSKAKRHFLVTDSVFNLLSDVESPQGILAVVRCRDWSWKDLVAKAPAPIVILDGIQDPGNLATILRTAEASGAAGVVTTPGTARLFSPKALRGAMGSTLRIPSLEHLPILEISAKLEELKYGLLAATMQSSDKSSPSYIELDWRKPWGILLGQEGRGLSKDWDLTKAQMAHIPMQSPVESLNVASVAAILLYESRRPR